MKKLRVGRLYQSKLWSRLLRDTPQVTDQLPDEILEITCERFADLDQTGHVASQSAAFGVPSPSVPDGAGAWRISARILCSEVLLDESMDIGYGDELELEDGNTISLAVALGGVEVSLGFEFVQEPAKGVNEHGGVTAVAQAQ